MPARELWRALFERIGRMAGVPLAYLEHAAPAPLDALWSRQDLGLAFMCGYPFATARPRPQAVAAPVPVDPRCRGRPVYWTDFVVSAESAFRSLPATFGRRIGWTTEHSQSGFNAVRHHLLQFEGHGPRGLYSKWIGPLVTPRRVVESVLSGAIEVGPLDSYFHDLLKRYEPDIAAGLRTVASSEPTPMPLLVASAGVDAQTVERLRHALVTCRADPDCGGMLGDLGLAAFATPAAEAYGVLLEQAARAEASGFVVPV
jgi:ABC-type phosphate/phosphonate transport system substrate-binding protein